MAVDRFRIFAETSSENMGPLLAQLTRMGLENIGYELITDVRTFKSSTRVDHGSSAQDFSMEWIKEHPTFKVSELSHHFMQSGRSGSTAHYAARRLAENGLIRELGGGNYQSVDVKALGHDKKDEKKPAEKVQPAKPLTRSRGKVRNYDVPNKDIILAFLQGRETVTVAEISTHLQKKGRTGHSASPIVSRMARDGLIKMIEPGYYRILKKAAKAIKDTRTDRGEHAARAQQPADTSDAAPERTTETVDG